MGPASRSGAVSLLGDSRVSRRRQGPVGQAAEARWRGSSHEGAGTRAFCRWRARWRAGRLRLGGCTDPAKVWTSRVSWGTNMGVAVSLNALAVFARDRGDVAVARALFEESLVLWRELGDQKAVARALSNLANVVKLQGDYDRARALLYTECLSIFRGTGRSDRRRLVAELPGRCRPRSRRLRRSADIVRTRPGNFSGTR